MNEWSCCRGVYRQLVSRVTPPGGKEFLQDEEQHHRRYVKGFPGHAWNKVCSQITLQTRSGDEEEEVALKLPPGECFKINSNWNRVEKFSLHQHPLHSLTHLLGTSSRSRSRSSGTPLSTNACTCPSFSLSAGSAACSLRICSTVVNECFRESFPGGGVTMCRISWIARRAGGRTIKWMVLLEEHLHPGEIRRMCLKRNG